MSKKYLILTSALLISIVSSFLTISGYIKMFSSYQVVVGALLLALEVAKLTIAGVVSHYTLKELPQKWVLMPLLGILMVVAALGHYGYLADAYMKDKTVVETMADNRNDTVQHQQDLRASIASLREMYTSIPAEMATKKRRMFQEVQPQINQLELELKTLTAEKKHETVNEATHNIGGTLMYSSKLLGFSPDALAKIIILTISILIDPLAMLMVSTYGSLPEHKRSRLPRTFTVINAKDYDVEGITVDDITDMSEDELRAVSHIFKSKTQREWFSAALCWREASLQGVTMDVSFQCDGDELMRKYIHVN